MSMYTIFNDNFKFCQREVDFMRGNSLCLTYSLSRNLSQQGGSRRGPYNKTREDLQHFYSACNVLTQDKKELKYALWEGNG